MQSVWDELVRVAASIHSGQCSAVQVLTRFDAAARGHPVYGGGVHAGRLFRTIFLIDYFTDPIFRAEWCALFAK
jgi:TnpA family transposase